jgi:hypothetical protein
MSSVCRTDSFIKFRSFTKFIWKKTWRNKKSFIGLLMGIKIFTKYTLSLIWDFTVHRKDGDKRLKRCRTFVQNFMLS